MHAAAGCVVVAGVLVALRVAPVALLLPFLVASTVGRRFASKAVHVEVGGAAVELGERAIPRTAILDTWLDDDVATARVTLAFSGEKDIELAVLNFENRPQAKRFAGAVEQDRATVVGHRPRPIDILPAARFLGIAVSFAAASSVGSTGSLIGLAVAGFFVAGAIAFVRARQIVVREASVEIRSAFGTRTLTYDELLGVDVDSGTILLKDGGELRFPRSTLRDTTMGSPSWLERARARVLLDLDDRRASRLP